MLVCPGLLICMTPPKLHMSLLLLLSAGILAIRTVGQPGAHGAAVIGVQGIGVNTPSAAAVAAATAGFAGELHMAKGNIFINGMLSIMFAKGMLFKTIFLGSIISELGAAPKEHAIIAPPQTASPIHITPSRVLPSQNVLCLQFGP